MTTGPLGPALDVLIPLVMAQLPARATPSVLAVDFTCSADEVSFEAVSVSYVLAGTTKHKALRDDASGAVTAFAAAVIDTAGLDTRHDCGSGAVVIDFSEQTVELQYAEVIEETFHRDFTTLNFDAVRAGARPVEIDPLENVTTDTQRQMLMAQWVAALGPIRDIATLTAAFTAVVEVLTSDQMEQVVRKTRGTHSPGDPDGCPL